MTMSASVIGFLMFVSSLGLCVWRPQSLALRGLHGVLWATLSFLASIDFLFSLSTVWWPPTQAWSVAWSSGAVLVLALTLASKTSLSDWV
jgi:hypothetical protein